MALDTRPEEIITTGRLSSRALVPFAAALAIACGVTVVLVTVFNYLLEPIQTELGLSRAAVAGALSVHLATLIVSLPLAGALADRFGAQRVMLVSALLFGASIAAIGELASGRTSLYALFALAGLLGAGASPVTHARVIVHRFSTHRGLALGIALTGTGLGGVLLPMLVRPIALEQGWREALLWLALVVTLVGVAAALVVGDDRSRRDGAAGDGDSLREAMAHRAFWGMIIAFALLGLALSGVVAHLTGIWKALGLRPADVPAFQAAMGLATIAGRLLGGALMDRVPAQFVGAGAALIGAAGIALLASGPGTAAATMVVAMAVGLCTGSESDVISFLSSRFFGLRHFARIYAVQGSFFMIGFSLGPIVAATGFDRIGVPGVLSACAGALVGSSLVLALLRGPTRAAR